LLCALIGLVAIGVFLPALGYDFVNYDDDVYVYRNTRVLEGWSAESAGWFLSNVACNFYHPLTMLSLLADASWHGSGPWGYHLTGILLHAGAAMALFLALADLSKAAWRSAFVAVIFAVHPLRVESVAWISERKDVLSGLFFALTLLSYSWYVRRPSTLRYLVVVSLFVLGLLAKPSLVTLPFLLLLLDFWPLRRLPPLEAGFFGSAGKLVLEKIPLLLFSVLASIVAVFAQGESVALPGGSFWGGRLLHVPVAYCTYIAQAVWPSGLAPFYPLGVPNFGRSLGALLLIGTLTAIAVFSIRRRPWIFVGWFWFVGMLVPMIGIVQIGSFAHADRFTYLPQIGLLIAVAWTFWDAVGSFARPRLVAAFAAAGVLAACLIATSFQLPVWKNSETLFRHTLNVTDRNAIAHFNLGAALEESGRASEALDHYGKAVSLWPTYPHARLNLGLTLASQRRPAEAIPHLQNALLAEPENTNALMVLAMCLDETGMPEPALAAIQRAAELEPRNPDLANAYGGLLRRQGRLDVAIAQYELALDVDPSRADVHNNLAVALCHARREREAIPHFREALRLSPDHPDAGRNLQAVLAMNPDLVHVP
jgi:tetratricopeptide (TPR) repeat protein